MLFVPARSRPARRAPSCLMAERSTWRHLAGFSLLLLSFELQKQLFTLSGVLGKGFVVVSRPSLPAPSARSCAASSARTCPEGLSAAGSPSLPRFKNSSRHYKQPCTEHDPEVVFHPLCVTPGNDRSYLRAVLALR